MEKTLIDSYRPAETTAGTWQRGFVRQHGAIWLILIAGLVVRLFLLASSADSTLHIVDEQHYAQLASSLVRGDGFAFGPGKPTSMRPPLYPLFVASVWIVTGSESLQAVRAVQMFLGLATTLLVYRLARRLFDQRTAVVAAAIVCFYPSLLFSGVLLLTEVLFTLLLVLFVLTYSALMDRPTPSIAVATGVALGLATLTRSVLWPFPIVLLPLVAVAARGNARRRLAIAACCLGGYVIVVGPWAFRNTRLQHTLTIVDTMGGMNLRMGNYEYTPEDRMWDAVSLTGERNWAAILGRTHPEAVQWSDGQKEKWAQREAIAYMLANPATTAKRSLLKFADFWGLEREMIAGIQQGLYRPPMWVAWLAILAVLISYPLIVLGAALGIFRAPAADARVQLLIVMIILFITGIHSAVFGHSRYHLPLVPLLAMYAAAVSTRGVWRPLLTRPWRAPGPFVIAVVLIVTWVHEVFFRDVARIEALVRSLAG